MEDEKIEVTKKDLDAKVEEKASALFTAKETVLNEKMIELERKFNASKQEPIISVNEKFYPLGRLAIAKAMSIEQNKDIKEVIEDMRKTDNTSCSNYLLKSGMTAGSLSGGGSFIPTIESSDMIDVLYGFSAMRGSGVPVMPLPSGNAMIKQNSAGTTAYWVGETTSITPSKMTTGFYKMDVKGLAALTQISNSLIRYSNVNVESIIQNDQAKAIAYKEDLAFFEGTGTAFQPKGIVNWIPTANTWSETGATSALIKTDLLKGLKLIYKNNIPMSSPVIVMHPNSYYYILAACDANSNPMDFTRGLTGNAQTNSGTIYGARVIVTTNITSTSVYFYEASQLLIGQGINMVIDYLPNATFTDDTSTVIYGANQDQSLIRTITNVDFMQRYSTAASVWTGFSSAS